MFEILIFLVSLAADQLLKVWSMRVLASIPGGTIDIIPNVFWLSYAENYGDTVSYIRGRSIVMNIFRIAQLALVLYLLIAKRDKLQTITRIGLVFFLVGLVGNQINYIMLGFVPDMLVFAPISNYTFNLADVFVVIAMIILFIRVLFFEGQELTTWLAAKLSKHEQPATTPSYTNKNDETKIESDFVDEN